MYPIWLRSTLTVIFLLGFLWINNSGCTAYKRFFTAADVPIDHCTELIQRAKEFTWERRYAKALELLTEASCLCGQSIDIQLMRGEIFYTLERWQEAREQFEAVLDQEPRNHQAVVRLWFIEAAENGFDEGKREILRNKALEYLEQDPQDPEVVYACVLGLEGARAITEKTEVIEKYTQVVDDPSWRKDLAELYFYDSLRTKDEILEKSRFFRDAFPLNRLRYQMADLVLSSLKESGVTAVQDEAKAILKKEPGNRVLNYVCAKAILNVNGDLGLAERYITRAIKAAKKPDPRDRYEFVDDITWDELMEKARSEYDATYGRIKYLQGPSKGGPQAV